MASQGPHHSFLELLVEAAIEIPNKPGTFSIDSQALRTLLFELVRTQQQGGDASSIALKASHEKLNQEVSALQYHVKHLEIKVDQLSSLLDSVNRMEDVINEIRENERIISESTNLLISDVEAVQDQLEAMESLGLGKESGLPPGIGVEDLLDRIEALESKTYPKKKTSPKSQRPVFVYWVLRSEVDRAWSLLQTGRKRSVLKKRYSGVDEVRYHLSNLSEKLSVADPIPLEPKFDMAKPFLLLKEAVTELGTERVTALEDFLSALKSSVVVQPKMLQELMIIFTSSSLEADFFALLVHAMNRYPSLTVTALTEILDLMLTSPCSPSALVSLYNVAVAEPSKLPLESVSAILNCVKDATKVTPHGLTELLKILVGCDQLKVFLKDMVGLESWNWKAFMNILEELHFSKNSTLMEMVVVMEKMSASELNELMYMLLSIPGYVNELILSLPHPPSLSTQRLLEHLISLPNDSPRLLAQAVDLMVSKPWLKESLLHTSRKVLELTTTLEAETRSSDYGFFQLLKMLHDAEDISLDNITEVLALIRSPDNFTLEAARALIQFSRASNNDFVGALTSLLGAFKECPTMKGELIQRIMRLIEKAKFVSPRHIEELLVIMQQSGMLRQANFDPVIKVFLGSELNTPYNLSEFFNMIRHLDFLTLDDLGHMLEQNQAAAKRAYEEAMERQARRLQELKELQEIQDGMGSAEDLRAEEEVDTNHKEEEEEEEGTKAEEKKAEAGTAQMEIPKHSAAVATPVIALDSAAQQAVTVDSACLQDLQKEVKDLQALVSTLMEEKPKKDKEKRRRSVEKERRRRLKPKSDDKDHTDEEPSGTFAFSSTFDRKSPLYGGTPLASSTDKVEGLAVVELASAILSQPAIKSEESEESFDEDLGSSSSVFHSRSSHLLFQVEMRDELSKLKEMVNQLVEYQKECRQRYEFLSETVSVKAESGELQRFQQAVKRQLHNFVHKTPPGPAGTKQPLSVNCLSCDTKGMNFVKSVERSLPTAKSFPPVLSQRPHRLYEMDIIRRHARSLLEGNSERVDMYSMPRACGGQHTAVDIRQTWTYEIHQKESGIRGADGKIYTSASRPTKGKNGGSKGSSDTEFIPRPPNSPRQ